MLCAKFSWSLERVLKYTLQSAQHVFFTPLPSISVSGCVVLVVDERSLSCSYTHTGLQSHCISHGGVCSDRPSAVVLQL